jgi:hypothetical protein
LQAKLLTFCASGAILRLPRLILLCAFFGRVWKALKLPAAIPLRLDHPLTAPEDGDLTIRAACACAFLLHCHHHAT